MANTGKGDSPLRSSWFLKARQKGANSSMLIRQEVRWADLDSAEKAVWTDWFFEATPTPPPPSGAMLQEYEAYLVDLI